MSFGSLVCFVSSYFIDTTTCIRQHHVIIIASENPFWWALQSFIKLHFEWQRFFTCATLALILQAWCIHDDLYLSHDTNNTQSIFLSLCTLCESSTDVDQDLSPDGTFLLIKHSYARKKNLSLTSWAILYDFFFFLFLLGWLASTFVCQGVVHVLQSLFMRHRVFKIDIDRHFYNVAFKTPPCWKLYSFYRAYQPRWSMKAKRKGETVLWREPCHIYRNVVLLLFSFLFSRASL